MGRKCHGCGLENHFQSVCRKGGKSKVAGATQDNTADEEENYEATTSFSFGANVVQGNPMMQDFRQAARKDGIE